MKKIVLLLLIFILLATFFFPFLASTPFGKPFFIGLLQARLHGHISIQNIRLSWFGPQHFENISFENADLVGKIKMFDSNVPFWKLTQLGDSFNLEGGSFSFPSYKASGEITNVKGQVQGTQLSVTGDTLDGGSLSVEGTFQSKQNFQRYQR